MNPHLQVLIANGLYDLATPFFASEYTVQQLAIELGSRDNISIASYEAGHMMYFHPPSLEKLKDDIDRLFNDALHHVPPA